MIALGFSDADVRPPAPCTAVTESGCTLVLLPEASARSGRDRLAAQTACLDTLETLVPFAAGTSPSETAARQWLAANRDTAMAALAALRGKGQLTLIAETEPDEVSGAPSTAQDGADWLRIRARATQAHRARCAALQSHLEACAHDLGGLRHAVRIGDRGLRFDLLVPHNRAPQIKQAWAAALARPALQTARWRATLTGAWPAAAFWTESEIS